MLYTYLLSESALARVDDYLANHWQENQHEYILGVQHRLTDDLVLVMIECDAKTAVWLELLS